GPGEWGGEVGLAAGPLAEPVAAGDEGNPATGRERSVGDRRSPRRAGRRIPHLRGQRPRRQGREPGVRRRLAGRIDEGERPDADRIGTGREEPGGGGVGGAARERRQGADDGENEDEDEEGDVVAHDEEILTRTPG